MTDEEFAEVYALAFETGAEVGYARRCHEEAAEWRHLAEHVRAMGRSRYLTYAELENARYDGPRDQYGKPRETDYPGATE